MSHSTSKVEKEKRKAEAAKKEPENILQNGSLVESLELKKKKILLPHSWHIFWNLVCKSGSAHESEDLFYDVWIDLLTT